MRKFFSARQRVRVGSGVRKGDENPESTRRSGRLGKADRSPSESFGQGKRSSRARYAFTDRAIFGGHRRIVFPEFQHPG